MSEGRRKVGMEVWRKREGGRNVWMEGGREREG